MAGIWYRLRAEWRTRWRAALVLGLVAGLAGAVTLTAVAGARRTRSAFDRLRTWSAAADVLVNPDLGSRSRLTSAAIARLPGVRDLTRAEGVLLVDLSERSVDGAFSTIPLASDGRYFYAQSRPKLLAGRLPDPDRPDEILVDRAFVRQKHLTVGDTWRPDLVTTAIPPDVQPDAETLAELQRGEHPTWTRPLALRIVGIGVDQTNLVVDQGYDFPGLLLTPAFLRRHRGGLPSYWGAAVRLRPGTSVRDFERAVERLVPDESIAFQTAGNLRAKVDRAVGPQAGALDVFALVVAVTGLLVVGQALARQTTLDARDHDTLRAIGTTRRQLFTLAEARTVPAALLAGVLTVGGAWLLSPLMPIGVGRVAEPDPGFSFDAVLIPGALAVAAVVLLLETVPAWRASRHVTARRRERPSLASRITGALGVSPAPAAGLRQALEAGRGTGAVPVRTTITSATIAVAAVTSALVVAASLGHLIDTPKLFGWRWDAIVAVNAPDPAGMPAAIRATQTAIDREPVVAQWSRFTISTVELAGKPITTLGRMPSRPRPAFATVAGRLPRTDREIALGSHTMDDLGVRIGGRVPARDLRGDTVMLQVVGRVVLPGLGTYPGSDKTAPGEGAVVTMRALRRLGPPFGADHVVIGFRSDATPAARTAMIRRFADSTGQDAGAIARTRQPADVVAYRDIRSTPLMLAAVLGLLATLTLAHGLVSSVRRRRQELALLKTLGFTRRQVSSAVAWNATTVVVLAILVGVPLGIVLGRWAWTALVDDLGAVAETVVPWAVLLVGVPLLLLVGNAVAFVPGRIAARLRPATVLRSE